MKAIVLMLLSLMVAVPCFAREQLIGLVEIPSLFGKNNSQGPPGQQIPKESQGLTLYSKPSKDSTPAASVQKPGDIESKEHGYEETSAVAYAHKSGWYLLKAGGKLGWISPEKVGQFRTYEKLIQSGLSYLTEHWDRRLYQKIGAEPFRLSKKGSEISSHDQEKTAVEVLQTKQMGEEVWLEVQVIQGRCEGEEKRLQRGWVRAYSENGEPNLWFYSRGC